MSDYSTGEEKSVPVRMLHRLLICPKCQQHFTLQFDAARRQEVFESVWFCSPLCQEAWNLSHDSYPSKAANVPECTRLQQALDREILRRAKELGEER